MEPSQPKPTEPVFRSSPTLHAGEVLGERFCIERFIAAGGMGEIYEARDSELGERVALKTIRPEIADDERAMKRFRREIRFARRVTHPNVCRTFDLVPNAINATEGQPPVTFVTMELLEGETLGERLERRGRLSIEEALPIVRQVVAALAAAHAAGVIHRDLKSTNVLLVPTTEGERAVVTDFGLARLDPEALALKPGSRPFTDTIGITGTPAYMTPEQLEGGQVTPATDVYSLGVLIYELITGTYPFHGDTFLAMAVARLRQDPLPPIAYLPDLDPRWNQAVLRCLAREPKARFATPLELIDFLDGVIPEPEPAAAAAPAPVSGRRAVVAAITAALAALLALGLVWSLRPPAKHRAEPPATAAARPRLVFMGLRELVPGGASAAIGEQLGTELERALAATGTDLRHEPGTELVLSGSFLVTDEAAGGKVRIDLRLCTASGEVLGALSETGAASDLAERTARRLAALIEPPRN